MFVFDSVAIRKKMSELGLSVVELAKQTGMSRQTVHSLLREGFRPLVPSAEALSEVLGLQPNELLARRPLPSPGEDVHLLLSRAVAGDPRAFELLPGAVCDAGSVLFRGRLEWTGLAARVLAAAIDVAETILARASGKASGTRRLAAQLRKTSTRLSRQNGKSEIGQPFFFGRGLLTEERIRQSTPEPMRRHDVFGAFQMDDFKRHMPCGF